MCDTMAIVRAEGVLFAKNSDRDPNEAQGLEWHPRAEHPAGATLRCTWIDVPQARETHAILISRPCWMWGAEMGTNEFGVTIGNEAIFTNQPYARTGLTGMDLIRLALERAESAPAACEVIVAMLRAHGQGGGCGHENRRFTYHNSFIVADTRCAFVLETAGREHDIEPIHGARSISNGLTIPAFAQRHGERLKTAVSRCRVRQRRTTALLETASGPEDLFAILRDHGEGRSAPVYSWINGAMDAPAMHAGGLLAASQTTASWVADLRPGAIRIWATATASPETSLFKPIAVNAPVALGPAPGDRADASFWWRHERFARKVMRMPGLALPLFAPERDALEQAWLRDAPVSQAAFDEHLRLLETWEARVDALPAADLRPWYVRRYWRKRNRRAGCRV